MSIKSMTKTLRFVLIGDSNTGKTTFFNKINYIMNKLFFRFFAAFFVSCFCIFSLQFTSIFMH